MAAAGTVRKTFKYKLQPTAEQQRQLEAVVWRCRMLYNTALEQRITWWRRAQGVGTSRFQQEAELKVQRARRDFHHKTALALVRAYDTIYHAAWPTANLLKNHHLATSIADAGWSAFLSILSFKAVCAGRSVVAVPPADTSQIGSGCGVLVAKGVSIRWHTCPDCGASLHRDHHAALNIERAGLALRGAVA